MTAGAGCAGAVATPQVKVAVLAEALARADQEEVGPAAAFLAGQLRQGRVGVGWGLLSAVEVDAAPSPSLTVIDVDRVVTELAGLAGPGSGNARSAALRGLFARACATPSAFCSPNWHLMFARDRAFFSAPAHLSQRDGALTKTPT